MNTNIHTAYAQNQDYVESNAALAEKIYLQFDSKIYTIGNIVWFKSIVANAYDHRPSVLSKVLYVELIGLDEQILEKKLIKLENGLGEGFFNLEKTFGEGLYLVRAYTEWNKNFDKNFIFKEYIKVFTPNKKSTTKAISDITLVEGQNRRLKARLNPFVVDSLHKNKLKVLVKLDNETDTLLLKKDKGKKYQLEYNIKTESRFATVQMQTTSQCKYSTTIVLNNEYLDLQFLPESGELVHGLPCKVGFKALNAHGQGKYVCGDIVDEHDQVITSFSSNSLGMGSFKLKQVDSTKTYYAQISSPSNNNQFILYPLPKVASLGNVLALEKQNEAIIISTLSNYLKNDSVCIQVSHRGVIYYSMKVKLHDGIFKVNIPVNNFPEGILYCTLFDNKERIVAERLYFNERPDTRMNIKLSVNKPGFAKRELSDVKIETVTCNGEKVNANLSMLVINKMQMGEAQQLRQNILSYFLLNSELKGEIENPGYYFRKDSCMHRHLDALMLTQGWRKYNYSKPFDSLMYQPESSLSVSGIVSSAFFKKKRKRAELTLLTFGKSKSVYTQTADSLGKFKFNLFDEYGKNMNILIQSSKKSGKKVNYTVSLDKKISPPINYNQIKTVEEVDSVVQVFVEKNLERNKIDEAFPLQAGNILIEEVEVKAFRLTPNRKKVIEEHGEPDEIIDGKAILAKEEKWSYGLYSVLLFNYPDKIRIIRGRDGNLYARIVGADATLVVIDGIPVKYYNYSLIGNIPTSEVSSFEIINCAKNFSNLFHEATGRFPEGIMCGGVVAIYTYGQKGLFGANAPVGIMQASVPVFSAPREFYAPKYDKPHTDSFSKPDLRALIYWEPNIQTDSLGKASVNFYNADVSGEMMVVVEGISENGEIGYSELSYKVEGKEQEVIIVE